MTDIDKEKEEMLLDKIILDIQDQNLNEDAEDIYEESLDLLTELKKYYGLNN